VLDALAQSNASWITFPARWIASVNSSSTVDGAAGFRDHVSKLEGRHLEIPPRPNRLCGAIVLVQLLDVVSLSVRALHRRILSCFHVTGLSDVLDRTEHRLRPHPSHVDGRSASLDFVLRQSRSRGKTRR
jgi:hypothetical protein